MSEDVFDIELDLTYANNSANEVLELRFEEGILVRGTGTGQVPVNGDVEHHWKDVLGIRLGGDFNVIENLLALRAGGFYETKGVDDEWLNVDFDLAERYGVGGGATVRVGPVDISIAYQHTFFGTLDNGGKGELKALSGDATSGFRSWQSVNGGKLTSSLDEVALGGTLRF